MSEARAICLTCRSKLFATVAGARSRWPPRASYATTSPDAQTLSRHGGQENAPSAQVEEHAGAVGAQPSHSELIRQPEPLFRDFTKRKDLRTRSRRRSPVSIFEKVVNGQKESADSEENSNQAPIGFELYQDLAKLKELGEQPDTSLAACFEFFNTKIFPQLQTESRLPKIFRRNVTRLFDDIERAKRDNMASMDLPTITETTTIRRKLNFFRPEQWTPLIISLVDYICQMGTSPQDFSSTESFEASQTLRAALLQDLVGAWRMFGLPQILLTHGELLHLPEGEFRLPPVRWQKLVKLSPPNHTGRALNSLFPRYVETQLGTLAPAVISTVVLLKDPIKSNPAIQESARDLISAVTQILATVPVDRRELLTMFRSHAVLGGYISERWSSFTVQANQNHEHLSKHQHRKSHAPSQRKHASMLHKQLGQALKSRDLKACNQAWIDFWGPSNTPDPERAQSLRELPEMFDYFIMVYTTMRQPSKAVAVWNSLGKVGLVPSIKTWNSLIEGCKRASNAAGIRNVWARLVESGVQLDTAIWTARISGLIETGDPEGGLQALEEMAKVYQASLQNGGSSSAVKPTIEPVNAAIAGLLRYGANDAAQKVLAWGSRHGIEPDIITFNTILRPLVRQGATEGVDKVFAMMKAHGVQADVATFTIILDGAMTSLGEEAPEQQIETVTRILAEMEAAGLEANLQTYGRMIYLLLQEGDSAKESVKAVLAHIWSKGLELSSHIYTMLAEYYFSRDPPDLSAVRDLIENRGLYSKFGIDRVFWERVVRGYSQVGDTTNALKAFGMIESSMSVTTSTLSDLLQALINNEQWDEAAQLAQKAKSQRELTQSDTAASDARFWRHRFWHLVSQYELLERKTEGSGP
ncbi:uncharacterized protein E0L32_011953 [Thyridium curvatum]|uniref:Pentatricopeptide repeat-containing protein n=1 Tax=Thyridium curvatum TaxID=1093900 RepID=A0A507B6N6_9PEZI|nr:uncharacterized protein E0L32_011953 [Thyridium curvatum]TPX17952.1 hypothetical protein E0L32_011953 [Thyridium curvatum]